MRARTVEHIDRIRQPFQAEGACQNRFRIGGIGRRRLGGESELPGVEDRFQISATSWRAFFIVFHAFPLFFCPGYNGAGIEACETKT